MPTLYLASRSPRRRELLQQIGVDFQLVDAEVDETPLAAEEPARYVERMARAKARAGLAQCRSAEHSAHPVVLGADTAVVVAGEIFGKPRDRSHGLAMLRRLADSEHQVLSAVCLTDGERERCELSATRIRFRTIEDRELAAYWDSGEPVDKAGGYAIQGLGAVFVEQLSGSYSGVVGLPLFETADLLRHFGVPCGLSP